VTFTNAPSKLDQSITFPALTNKTIGEPPFTLSATASSGLPVSFAILSGPATNSGAVLTLTNTGTVVVRASQAGDANYNAATNVDQSFTCYALQPLTITPSGNQFVFSWSTNVAGYTIDATTNLSPPIVWSPVSASPVVVNGQNTITVTPTNNPVFYRLKK